MSQPQQPHRKRHSLFPWWLHVLLAIFIYTACKYIIPDLLAENTFLHDFGKVAPSIAPIGAIVFLLLAANTLYNSEPEEKEEEDEAEETQNPAP